MSFTWRCKFGVDLFGLGQKQNFQTSVNWSHFEQFLNRNFQELAQKGDLVNMQENTKNLKNGLRVADAYILPHEKEFWQNKFSPRNYRQVGGVLNPHDFWVTCGTVTLKGFVSF